MRRLKQLLRRLVMFLPVPIAVAALLVLTGAQVFAQDEEIQEPIRVVTKEIEPFVFVVGGEVTGFSIDLWEALARESDLEFEYEIVTTVQEQLDAVENNEADAAVAAITITEEREKSVDFTHAYFESGLGILTNINSRHTIRDALRAAAAPSILLILAGLIVTIIIAGHVIWLLERRRNPEFPQTYFKGVWEGIWWSAVTVTTVGYGDKTPLGRIGRVFSIFWMLVGVLIIANFTAGVTSELTLQRIEGVINGPYDLHGKRVVTVGGSTADDWLANQGIRHSTVQTVEDAYALLDAKTVQAVVYDYPVLVFHALQNPDKGYTVPGDIFHKEDYGIAVSAGSPLREELNRSLLRILENGTYDQIYAKWYGIIID